MNSTFFETFEGRLPYCSDPPEPKNPNTCSVTTLSCSTGDWSLIARYRSTTGSSSS